MNTNAEQFVAPDVATPSSCSIVDWVGRQKGVYGRLLLKLGASPRDIASIRNSQIADFLMGVYQGLRNSFESDPFYSQVQISESDQDSLNKIIEGMVGDVTKDEIVRFVLQRVRSLHAASLSAE